MLNYVALSTALLASAGLAAPTKRQDASGNFTLTATSVYSDGYGPYNQSAITACRTADDIAAFCVETPTLGPTQFYFNGTIQAVQAVGYLVYDDSTDGSNPQELGFSGVSVDKSNGAAEAGYFGLDDVPPTQLQFVDSTMFYLVNATNYTPVPLFYACPVDGLNVISLPYYANGEAPENCDEIVIQRQFTQ